MYTTCHILYNIGSMSHNCIWHKEYGRNRPTFIYNLCTPFKHDSRCALFSLLSFVTTNSTPQREAQRMSCLKGVQRLFIRLRLYFNNATVTDFINKFIKTTRKLLILYQFTLNQIICGPVWELFDDTTCNNGLICIQFQVVIVNWLSWRRLCGLFRF